MHPLIKFLKEHPHCTKPFCTTCGGLFAFQWDLNKWADEEAISLVDLLRSLTIEDLEPIREWPEYVSRILTFIQAKQFNDVILPEWRKVASRSAEFGRMILLHAPLGTFNSNFDKEWVTLCLSSYVYHFDCEDLRRIEGFLGETGKEFPNLTVRREFLENELRIENDRKRCEEEERKKQLAAEHEALIQKTAQLESMPPLERLLALLNDSAVKLEDYPSEWANISEEAFDGINSLELTGVLRRLDALISKRRNGQWKDLRSRLYLLRQKVFNKEHYQRSVHNQD